MQTQTNPLPFGGFDAEEVIVPMAKKRNIPKIPYKVLDAPSLLDDFYLNLVDWSNQNDLYSCFAMAVCAFKGT